MEFEFMTAGTALPPCMPLPPVLLRLPASSTAKVMYARMLDEALAYGIEDENGILYIHFPIKELAAALSRSTMTIKRAMSELDDMGLVMRVRRAQQDLSADTKGRSHENRQELEKTHI